MKNLVCRILPLGGVLLVRGVHPLPVRAQQDAPASRQAAAVFEQADEIVVYTPDSFPVARRTIARVLQANGFVLDTVLATMVQTRYALLPRQYGARAPTRSAATAYVRSRGLKR